MTTQAPPDNHVRTLARLFHHRWAPAVLAELTRSPRALSGGGGKSGGGGVVVAGGGRVVTLAHRLDASRDSVRAALDSLVKLGLAKPNPGYGHPLRPDFLPTARGVEVGPRCARLLASIDRMDAHDAALRKWAMPTVLVIDRGAARFSHIAAALPGVTPRALTMTLRDLEASDIVRRTVEVTSPPRSRYTPTRRARALAPILDDIAHAAA